MTTTRGTVVAALLLVGLLAAGCERERAGLLLGLRRDEPGEGPSEPPRTAYRTLWIAPAGDGTGVRVAGEWPGLVVPRGDAAYRIEVRRSGFYRSYYDHPWIAPAGAGADAGEPLAVGPLLEFEPGEEPRGSCGIRHHARILFASPDLLATEWEVEDCLGREAVPYDQLRVVGLPDGGAKRLAAVLGEAGAQQFTLAAGRLGTPSCIEPAPDDRNWGLVRRRGQWVVRGRLGGPRGWACRHRAVDFDVPVTPAAVVGHDALWPAWETLARSAPGLIDAYAAPGRDLLVLLTRTELLVHRPRGDEPGEPVARKPLLDGEAPVMVQWATGSTVRRWERLLQPRGR